MIRLGLLAIPALLVAVNAPGGAPPEDNRATAQMHNETGITYANDFHFDVALQYFNLAQAESENDWAVLNNLANVYLLLEEHSRARRLYEEALANPLSTGQVRLNLGLLYHTQGDDEQMKLQFRIGAESLKGGYDEVRRLMGLSGGTAPVDGPRADAPGDLTLAQLEALIRRAEQADPEREALEPEAAVREATPSDLKGFQGAHLKPYRLIWLRMAQ